MNDNETWIAVIAIGLLLLLLGFAACWVYRSEYADCMAQKDDPIICEMYATRWLSW